MGSPVGDPESASKERPEHGVTIENGFWMGKYEVTQAQWSAVMGTTPSYFLGNPNNPVERVSWDDCQSFMQKMNLLDGNNNYTLPSESQWEYACRAGITDPYYGLVDDIAWHSANSGWGPNYVGDKIPNNFGLYDMSGNVFEWCSDKWHGGYTGAPADGSSWDESWSTVHVIRGGNWRHVSSYCRSAARFGAYPDSKYYNIGFRPVILNGNDTPYTIGGTVTGLTGTLVLQNNGGDDLVSVRSSLPLF